MTRTVEEILAEMLDTLTRSHDGAFNLLYEKHNDIVACTTHFALAVTAMNGETASDALPNLDAVVVCSILLGYQLALEDAED